MQRMAKLNKKDVEHIAKLSNLKITEEEVEKFSEQLSAVITYFEELKEVETSAVEPTSQTTGLKDVKRIDAVDLKSTLSQEEALSGSDKTIKGYFAVPMVLEGRTDR